MPDTFWSRVSMDTLIANLSSAKEAKERFGSSPDHNKFISVLEAELDRRERILEANLIDLQ